MKALRLLALSSLALSACSNSNEPFSPSDPRQFSVEMYDTTQTAKIANLDARAYVMGHALGVYAFGKTLPKYAGSKGYVQEPGYSAEIARVHYNWDLVMAARAGGTDGRGAGYVDDVYPPGTRTPTPDDVGGPTGGQVPTGGENGTYNPGGTPTTPTGTYNPGGSNQNPDGTPTTPTGTYNPGGNQNPDGTPTNPTGTTGGGNTPTGGEQPGTPDRWIDGDCETFLDPAGWEARDLIGRVDIENMMGADLGGANHEQYVAKFQQGLADALSIRDEGDSIKYSEVDATKKHARGYGLCDYSPLVLDLAGDGIEASALNDGVAFDLRQAGRLAQVAWPKGDDALLVLDRDGDGLITSGGELFGSSFTATGDRYSDGFAALAELDRASAGGNGDGQIDVRDAAYVSLRLWRDGNRDGVSQPGELSPLLFSGVESISLGHVESSATDRFGNGLRQHGRFVRIGADGTRSEQSVIDVWFKTRAL